MFDLTIQQHHDKLLYMCYYFKNIHFIMDIVPQILNDMDNLYIHDIITDAFQHGWRDYGKLLIPPNSFECALWASHIMHTPTTYLVPHWIYNTHVRQKGTY